MFILTFLDNQRDINNLNGVVTGVPQI